MNFSIVFLDSEGGFARKLGEYEGDVVFSDGDEVRMKWKDEKTDRLYRVERVVHFFDEEGYVSSEVRVREA